MRSRQYVVHATFVYQQTEADTPISHADATAGTWNGYFDAIPTLQARSAAAHNTANLYRGRWLSPNPYEGINTLCVYVQRYGETMKQCSEVRRRLMPESPIAPSLTSQGTLARGAFQAERSSEPPQKPRCWLDRLDPPPMPFPPPTVERGFPRQPIVRRPILLSPRTSGGP